MKMSRRAKRMQRNHTRNANKSGLNLTALMDIFTILVFFLMVNQSDVQIQNNDDVDLPVSLAKNQPADQLVILVTTQDILVQGRRVASVADALANKNDTIDTLAKELAYLSERTPTSGDDQEGRSVTIMGDKNTAYPLLKKIMNTCVKHRFNAISLAVKPQPGGGDA